MAVWGGECVETIVWLILGQSIERKESGSVGGSKHKNQYAAHCMEKKTREKEEWMGAGVETSMRLISQK